MKTEIKDKTCNGWAVIDKTQLLADDPCNYHIVEAKVSYDNEKKRNVVIAYTRTFKTCCGIAFKKDAQYRIGSAFLESEVSELRNYLADKQNGDWEICGRCVSHFYKDQA